VTCIQSKAKVNPRKLLSQNGSGGLEKNLSMPTKLAETMKYRGGNCSDKAFSQEVRVLACS